MKSTWSILILSTCLFVPTCIKKTRHTEEKHQVKTVSIPQSPVKNKKFIGFCWAYASVDFFESEYKRIHGGAEMILSPEALGFFRMAEGMHEIIQESATAADAIQNLSCQRLQGLSILTNTKDSWKGAFNLVQKYGLWPESVYRVKFEEESIREQTLFGIRERFEKLLSETQSKRGSFKETTIEDIIEKVMVNPPGDTTAPSAFKTRPPLEFETEKGVRVKATEFSKSVIENIDEYKKIAVDTQDELNEAIRLIKTSLGMGRSVPLGLGVDRNHLFREGEKTVFSGKKSHCPVGPCLDQFYKLKDDPLIDPKCPKREMTPYNQGRHDILITDFLNKGGQLGKLESPSAMQSEIQKPATELDSFHIKNNWGVESPGQEGESSWLPSVDGYYFIDKEYLEQSIQNGVSLNFVIHSSIMKVSP